MMFLLGIYCAGGYGGSVSAILINTPGTPHAAATMLDGHPLSKMGRTKAALKIALYASTFGGIFSALVLLFLGPQVAKISAQLGTAEYFMVCLFGMTIIAGVSGKSLVKGIIAACLGLLISCVGADPMTSYDRFTFGVHRLYLGLDLAVTLIGLFALVEIIGKAELKRSELNLHAGKIGNDDGKITKDEYKRMLRRCSSALSSAPAWALCRYGRFGSLLVLLQHGKEYVQTPGRVRPRFCGGRCGGGVGQQRCLRCDPHPPC